MHDFTAEAIEDAKIDNLTLVHLVISERCGAGTDKPRHRVTISGPLPRQLERQLDDIVLGWIERTKSEIDVQNTLPSSPS